jgi:hypothetical protein
MLISAILILAAAVYVGFSIEASRRRDKTVRSERAPLHYSAVQIVCADCAGDSLIPVRTFVNRHGFCDRCGGSSYVLASTRGAYLIGLVGRDQRGPAEVSVEGRVLPFETRPSTSAPERIAV